MTQYAGIAAVMLFFCLIVVLLALRMLVRNSWFAGFIRGITGLGLFAMALVFSVVALDIYSYQQLDNEHSLATVSFERKGTQHFEAYVVASDGKEQRFELGGDLWQLDARILKWGGTFKTLGIQPGYRLGRISGRYLSIEQERTEPRTVYELSPSEHGFDFWEWIHSDKAPSLLTVDASYGSATFLPMEDGALYSVSLTTSGLIARPLNDRAKTAVNRWQ